MTGAGATVKALDVIAMTDARTHRAHLVTDEAAAASRAEAGCYVAVRGTVLLAASLTTPETGVCRFCADWRRNGGRAPWGRSRADSAVAVMADGG